MKGIQRPMRKINEIFYSIQGEGCHTGVPSVFIRFSGCNLKCDFCDTSHNEGIQMTDEEIFKEVKKHDAAMIILTGGEPSLHIDEKFIEELKKETGLPIAIETNGTRSLPCGIDWITVSPKQGLTGHTDEKTLKEEIIRVERADELKVVDLGQDLKPYYKLGCVTPETVFLLQPCYVPDKSVRENNTRRTIRRVLENPRWRLSLQTHRLIGVR